MRRIPPPPSFAPALDVVVAVGPAAQVEADQDTTAEDQEQTQEDVDQGGGPEGKQVESPVTVRVHICCVPVVVGFINGIDPHITSNEPAEEEERRQRVPGRADGTERVVGVIIGLLGAGQAGEHGQQQAEDPHHDQIDGDVVLPRTVVQMHRTYCNLSNGHDANNQLRTY